MLLSRRFPSSASSSSSPTPSSSRRHRLRILARRPSAATPPRPSGVVAPLRVPSLSRNAAAVSIYNDKTILLLDKHLILPPGEQES